MNRNAISRLGLCTLLGLLACSKDQDGDHRAWLAPPAGDRSRMRSRPPSTQAR